MGTGIGSGGGGGQDANLNVPLSCTPHVALWPDACPGTAMVAQQRHGSWRAHGQALQLSCLVPCVPASQHIGQLPLKLHFSCHAGHHPALSFWFNVLGTSKHGLKGLVPPVPHHPPPQVALDPVQYARSGAFTVNLWFKPGKRSGSQPIASVPAPAQLLCPRGSGPPGGLKEQSPHG